MGVTETLPPRPIDRSCKIPDCRNKCRIFFRRAYWKWKTWSVCSAHEKRKQRLGSYTARMCYRCKTVVDDEHDETGRLNQGNGRTWFCQKCMISEGGE